MKDFTLTPEEIKDILADKPSAIDFREERDESKDFYIRILVQTEEENFLVVFEAQEQVDFQTGNKNYGYTVNSVVKLDGTYIQPNEESDDIPFQ